MLRIITVINDPLKRLSASAPVLYHIGKCIIKNRTAFTAIAAILFFFSLRVTFSKTPLKTISSQRPTDANISTSSTEKLLLITIPPFERIESIPLQVVFASSVESGEGNAEYLVDGNPNTYWHTMWSVTVANYPHWVDFDCGSVKALKGFKYLPRQDSRNGNIRQYSIQVSDDGNKWSQPVCEGEFANDQKEKRVLFEKPVSARFVRFNALSSQDGQDFATGAEFSILEK